MGDVSLSAPVRTQRARSVWSKLLVPSESPTSLERIVRWAAPVSVAVLIFVGSSIPAGAVSPQLQLIPDKLAHFLEYFVLAATLIPAIAASWPATAPLSRITAATLLASLFGVSDEFHQMAVPGRDPNGYDLLADACGALAGSISAAWLARRARING